MEINGNIANVAVKTLLIMASAELCHSYELPTLQSVALYQPNDVLVSRIGDNATILSEYILQVQKVSIESSKHHSEREFAVIIAWTNDKTIVYTDAKESELKADLDIRGQCSIVREN